MIRKINSDRFAKRMGSYSHGYVIESTDLVTVFTTGQIAMDKDGNVLYPNDPENQARYIYETLGVILKEADMSLNDAVKTTVYLTNMNDFASVSKVRNEFLRNSEPVSTLVEVNRLVKEGAVVEIEIVAVKEKTHSNI